MKCPNCGAPCGGDDRFCSYCGDPLASASGASSEKQEIHIHYHQESRPEPQVRVEHIYEPSYERRSSRSRTIALLLCFFLGIFGVHKFYLGRIGMGILYILTYGFFGIGWLVDMCVLIFGSPRDKDGYKLTWH